MPYEHKDMSGTIFRNQHKQLGDNGPDYRGKIMVRGELLEIALWVKDGQNGKFFSAKIQERREKPPQYQPPAPRTGYEQKRPNTINNGMQNRVARPSLKDDMNDEVPF